MSNLTLPFEDQKLWDYLKWNAYVSERNKLVYVNTPKVAGTSLKWWFAELEGYAGLVSEVINSLESDTDLIIHDSFYKVAPNVTGLLPEKLAEPIVSNLYFRFALVRNPYNRIFSAWQSKLLLREPLQIKPYLKYNFLWLPIKTATDVSLAFESFLEHLESLESPDFWDVHWTPQVTLLRPDLISYNKIFQIENATQLIQFLANRLGSDFTDPFSKYRVNVSLIPFNRSFITDRSAELIQLLYDKDFATFGYDRELPESKEEFSNSQLRVALQAIHLIRGRNQRIDQTRSVLSENINRLSQELENSNGQITKLNQEVENSNEQIVKLNQEVGNRNFQIARLNKDVENRDEQITRLKRDINNRDDQILRLNRDVDDRTNEINAIINSRYWKIIKPLRKLKRLIRYKRQIKD